MNIIKEDSPSDFRIEPLESAELMKRKDKIRVLVIDDSREVRDFVIDYVLKPNDFEIDVAVNGAEGLQKALTSNPDLILMDYEMPLMTGLEVLRELRKQKSKIPVILMTSHGSEQVAVEVFRLGVSDYVNKPFAISDMLDSIENALYVTRLQREKDALTEHLTQTNKQLEQRLHELKILYRVGKSITTLLQPDALLERIVEAMLFMVKGEEAALVLIDPKTGKLRKRVRKLSNPTINKKQLTTSRLTLMTKEMELDTSTQNGNLLSAPLQVGQKVAGTLTVSKKADDKFTEHDDQLLCMLADYASIALRNLELMTQLHKTKEKEKKQIRGLFERYVPATVVGQMLDNTGHQVSLGGKRQNLTVLFADVRGFSTFSSRTSPEVLIQLLNQYMGVAADAVLEQEGTLDKFMGDAVMAFFNAPVSQPDHVIRAIRAAWKLCRAVEMLHKHLIPEHRLAFGVGVGVGEAVVGNIGTAQMMNYTIIGDSVNKVKRLQENAKGGQILISQETYFVAQEYIWAQSVGDITLKGQSKPEPVYEILKLR